MKPRPNRRPASRGDVVARVAVLIGLATAAGLLASGDAPSEARSIGIACSGWLPHAAL